MYTPFIPNRVWTLIVFVMLLISSQALLQTTFSEQKTAGMVINLAGKQRMLSQQILSYSCMNRDAESASHLLSTTKEFYENHDFLLNGSAKNGIPLPDETFEAELLGLSGYVDEMRQLVFDMVDGEENNFLKLKLVADRYLPRMDMAVLELADRSKERVEKQNLLNIASAFIMFFVGIVMYRNYRIKVNQKNIRAERAELARRSHRTEWSEKEAVTVV
ncbi:MAG: type IV pili methyl-accepting chemotaxis transducer N-terminal domain-containing protein [Saprospiraceae bacterium]